MVSIIGAGRLSFRVRDGSGRFPAAVAAVTLFNWAPVFFGGGVWVWFVVAWLRACLWCYTRWFNNGGSCLPDWVCVSFRPVSASSLRLLLVF